MKLFTMKFMHSILFSCTCLLCLPAQSYQDSCRSQTAQKTQDQLCEELSIPIVVSAEGLNNFYKHIYNKPEYGKEILPNNFSHLIQFLDHGKKVKLTKNYTQSVLRLFANKLKSSSYVNAYAFAELMETMQTTLGYHFTIYRYDTTHLNQLTDLLYDSIVKKYPKAKSPETFCSTLSQEILDVLNAPDQSLHDITGEELRKTIIIFLEVALSKLIWSPQDGMQTWQTVRKITEHLTVMMDHAIIMDADDLNDLFTTLLERYTFFLDIAGHEMPLTTFSAIKSDIKTSPLLLLEFEEQDQLIEPKKQRLYRALLQGEAKAKAYQEHGIIPH